jgi:hypothetical protein
MLYCCFWGLNDKSAKVTASAALYEATEAGRESQVRLLIERGADVKKPFRRLASAPLSIACFHGYSRIAKLLIEAGADTHATNNKGETLMHFVVNGGWLAPDQNHGAEEPRDHSAVAELLLKNGSPASGELENRNSCRSRPATLGVSSAIGTRHSRARAYDSMTPHVSLAPFHEIHEKAIL